MFSRETVARFGAELEVVAVSAELCLQGRSLGDPELIAESGLGPSFQGE